MPDATGKGVRGAGKPHGLIIKDNRSFVRPIDALQNPHQRRLARAVAADNGMNRARRDGQFDRIVGDDRPIPAG